MSNVARLFCMDVFNTMAPLNTSLNTLNTSLNTSLNTFKYFLFTITPDSFIFLSLR